MKLAIALSGIVMFCSSWNAAAGSPEIQQVGKAGWYIGAGGFTGSSTGFAGVGGDIGTFTPSPTTPELSGDGLTVFGGYNAFSGPVMLGFEGELRREIRPSRSTEVVAPSAGLGSPNETSYFELQEQASPSMAFRLGYEIGPALFFGRTGLGVSIIDLKKIKGDNDGKVSDVYPVTIIGAGSEYYFERIFVRAEMEARYLHLDSEFNNETAIRYGGVFSVGLKF